jgi:hypothetical protein
MPKFILPFQARVSSLITIDCPYRYRLMRSLLLSQSIAIVRRSLAFATAMGLPPFIPLYYVGVYGDDECCLLSRDLSIAFPPVL